MAGEARERTLECDCGFVARGDDDEALVLAAQSHARLCHDMNLPAELILTLAAAPPRQVPS